MGMRLRCVSCSHQLNASLNTYRCTHCQGVLEVVSPTAVDTRMNSVDRMNDSLWRYRDKLPPVKPASLISLGEGLTPLRSAERWAGQLSGFRGTVRIKDETRNPTGSFKDRMVTVAVSVAVDMGAKGIICASSGNAAAAAAAYGRVATLPTVILVPAKTPSAKVAQIAAYGVDVVRVEGDYSRVYQFAAEFSVALGLANVTTTYLNPFGVEGLTTIGLELSEQLAPEDADYVFVPVGAGPLVRGILCGFTISRPDRPAPRLVAVQSEGCAPIVQAFERGGAVKAWDEPVDTIASGISDPLRGYEQDGDYTLHLVRKSGGFAIAVSDSEIRDAMITLARTEGILAEPTGAAALAGVRRALIEGRLAKNASIVCMVTAHAFKDFRHFVSNTGRVRRATSSRSVKAAIRTAIHVD